jgi:hypothetical protein
MAGVSSREALRRDNGIMIRRTCARKDNRMVALPYAMVLNCMGCSERFREIQK